MRRRTLITWWIVGTGVLALGAILIIADTVALVAHLDGLAPAARNGLAPDDFSRTMVILVFVGVGVAAVGLLIEFAAWISALANTRPLADRRWFNALLWTGIIGIVSLPLFGLGALIGGSAMVAYLTGGPDPAATGSAPSVGASDRPPVWPKATIVRWSTWGLVPLLGGGLLLLAMAYLSHAGGPLNSHVWTGLVLVTTGITIAVCGGIVESVAWWAALFNAHELADRTWFNVLVWGGIAAILTMPIFGFGALIAAGIGLAYRAGAPDGLAAKGPQSPAHTAG